MVRETELSKQLPTSVLGTLPSSLVSVPWAVSFLPPNLRPLWLVTCRDTPPG